jgi:SET domain-containing protein
MSLVVRPSPIHSVGVYTSKPIRKGTRVVEYDGERITAEEADRRYDGVSRTYLYGLDDGKTVIDGHGLGAYLNHSCDPNCEVDEIKGRVWLFAWDYNLYDDDDPAPCYCGSPKCRGTMYSREWMAKMRRQQARKKKRKSEAAQKRRTARKTNPSRVTAA